jgi:hypothetical protein
LSVLLEDALLLPAPPPSRSFTISEGDWKICAMTSCTRQSDGERGREASMDRARTCRGMTSAMHSCTPHHALHMRSRCASRGSEEKFLEALRTRLLRAAVLPRIAHLECLRNAVLRLR